jgi:hypothetical protein
LSFHIVELIPAYHAVVARDRGDEVAHWAFWRKAFWTRPALLLAYTVLVVTGGVAGLVVTAAVWPDYLAVARGRVCLAEPAPCLDQVPGQITGPVANRSARGPTTYTWTFRSADGSVVDEFDVHRQRDDEVASAQRNGSPGLLRHGEVVALMTPDGILPVGGADLESVTLWLLALVLVPGVATIGVRWSRLKARDSGGWWATPVSPGEYSEFWLAAWLMGPITWSLTILFGLPAWVGLPAAVGFVAWLWRSFARRPRRRPRP